jgi:hypothetical protein
VVGGFSLCTKYGLEFITVGATFGSISDSVLRSIASTGIKTSFTLTSTFYSNWRIRSRSPSRCPSRHASFDQRQGHHPDGGEKWHQHPVAAVSTPAIDAIDKLHADRLTILVYAMPESAAGQLARIAQRGTSRPGLAQLSSILAGAARGKPSC